MSVWLLNGNMGVKSIENIDIKPTYEAASHDYHKNDKIHTGFIDMSKKKLSNALMESSTLYNHRRVLPCRTDHTIKLGNTPRQEQELKTGLEGITRNTNSIFRTTPDEKTHPIMPRIDNMYSHKYTKFKQ
jgi:hypothetical protein